MKVVAVYLKYKLKKQFVKFSPEIMPCGDVLAVGVLEITIIFKGIATFKFS